MNEFNVLGVFGIIFIGFVLYFYTSHCGKQNYSDKVRFKPLSQKDASLLLDDDEKDLFERPGKVGIENCHWNC